ncbi:unnamed protein product [Closterium sp. NIES-54]
MVRPIVSVHVRQSDKQVEMGVWSFAAHMLFAARLQRTHVDLKHVWLSTEMQASQHVKALLQCAVCCSHSSTPSHRPCLSPSILASLVPPCISSSSPSLPPTLPPYLPLSLPASLCPRVVSVEPPL